MGTLMHVLRCQQCGEPTGEVSESLVASLCKGCEKIQGVSPRRIGSFGPAYDTEGMLVCPACGEMHFMWEGTRDISVSIVRETRTRFYGTIETDGYRETDDYETIEVIRERDDDYQETIDQEWTGSTAECTNCGHVVDVF